MGKGKRRPMGIRETCKRHVRLIVVVTLTFVIALLVYATEIPPQSLRAVDGPSADGLSTRGVFRPGGYIELTLRPSIESIDGRHSATVEIRPALTEVQRQDGLSWPMQHFEGDHDWPSSIDMKGSESFSVSRKISVPDDSQIAGRTILLDLTYKISYAIFAAAEQYDVAWEDVRKEIAVTIGAELSPDEMAWRERQSRWRPYSTVAIVLLGCCCLWCVLTKVWPIR